MAKHRAHGEGSITFLEKKGLWQARITLPNGKRKAKYDKQQSVVKKWLLEERVKLGDGNIATNDKITVDQLMKRYLDEYVAENVRPTTYRSYEHIIRCHILPEFGNVKLSKLTPEMLDNVYRKKRQAGESKFIIFKIHKIMRQALNRAVRWHYISSSPTKLVDKTPPFPKTNQQVLDTEQVKTFLAAVRNHRWAGVYYLACGTGMRIGEILGLPLTALNLDDGYLQVVQSLYWLPQTGAIIQEPKTEMSKRFVQIPPFVLEVLRETLERRAEYEKSERWEKDCGLVFTTTVGSPIEYHNLIRHFKSVLKETGLPNIRFHDLRHTVATLLLSKDVNPKIVQYRSN
jgi:integrase